jgi:hypothetical protein
MENHVIFYGHLVYFTAIGNILWPFDIFCGNLVYFSPFWYFGPRKIWQPCYVVFLLLLFLVTNGDLIADTVIIGAKPTQLPILINVPRYIL